MAKYEQLHQRFATYLLQRWKTQQNREEKDLFYNEKKTPSTPSVSPIPSNQLPFGVHSVQPSLQWLPSHSLFFRHPRQDSKVDWQGSLPMNPTKTRTFWVIFHMAPMVVVLKLQTRVLVEYKHFSSIRQSIKTITHPCIEDEYMTKNISQESSLYQPSLNALIVMHVLSCMYCHTWIETHGLPLWKLT